MKLWHDDVRPAPEGWVWVKNNDDAKALLEHSPREITHISLDHDLGADMWENKSMNSMGDSEDNGMKLVDWMIENDICPRYVVVHSWSPRAFTMTTALRAAFDAEVQRIPYSTEYFRACATMPEGVN